jgi:hypothetical protein
MSRADDSSITIPRMASPDTKDTSAEVSKAFGSSGARFAVITSGSDGVRRYGFDSILTAMHRFELEAVTTTEESRIELLMIVASRVVS